MVGWNVRKKGREENEDYDKTDGDKDKEVHETLGIKERILKNSGAKTQTCERKPELLHT